MTPDDLFAYRIDQSPALAVWLGAYQIPHRLPDGTPRPWQEVGRDLLRAEEGVPEAQRMASWAPVWVMEQWTSLLLDVRDPLPLQALTDPEAALVYADQLHEAGRSADASAAQMWARLLSGLDFDGEPCMGIAYVLLEKGRPLLRAVHAPGEPPRQDAWRFYVTREEDRFLWDGQVVEVIDASSHLPAVVLDRNYTGPTRVVPMPSPDLFRISSLPAVLRRLFDRPPLEKRSGNPLDAVASATGIPSLLLRGGVPQGASKASRVDFEELTRHFGITAATAGSELVAELLGLTQRQADLATEGDNITINASADLSRFLEASERLERAARVARRIERLPLVTEEDLRGHRAGYVIGEGDGTFTIDGEAHRLRDVATARLSDGRLAYLFPEVSYGTLGVVEPIAERSLLPARPLDRVGRPPRQEWFGVQSPILSAALRGIPSLPDASTAQARGPTPTRATDAPPR